MSLFSILAAAGKLAWKAANVGFPLDALIFMRMPGTSA